MTKARGIVYQEVPDPGTTQGHPWSSNGTSRSWINYQSNNFTFNNRILYRYSDYSGWDTDPDMVILWLSGNSFLQPTTGVFGHIAEQSRSVYGTTTFCTATHPSGGGAGGWKALLGYAQDMIDWIHLVYGAGANVVLAGHSAGAHLMCHMAHIHDYPWVAISGVLDMAYFDNQAPWASPMSTALGNIGFTTSNYPRELSVPFSKNSPPGYLIYSPDDTTVNPAHSEGIIAALKNWGADVTYDRVDTGVEGDDHIPLDNANLDNLRAWFDRWR